MATKRDYYEVLQVSRDADTRQIKSAYRKLALEYHPDKNPGDAEAEARFKEAAEAYAVLSDPEKRARYDRFGHQANQGPVGFDPSIFSDFSDILGDLFGFGGRAGGAGRRVTRGTDLRYDLRLSFEEAAFGTEAKLRIPRLENCEACRGSGARAGTEPEVCSACGGRGQVRYSQGFFTVARTCPQCSGEGRTVRDPCPECRGNGQIERQREIEVQIPAGVDSGARLRVTGGGEHGRNGGPPGDLFVFLEVAPHERFERNGADVLSEVDVTYSQAVLGASVEIDTLQGKETLEIPPGTESGHQFRLRGKGIARLNRSGFGDHLVRTRLIVPRPRDLDDEQQQLLRQLADLEGVAVREGRGIFSKIKDHFG